LEQVREQEDEAVSDRRQSSLDGYRVDEVDAGNGTVASNITDELLVKAEIHQHAKDHAQRHGDIELSKTRIPQGTAQRTCEDKRGCPGDELRSQHDRAVAQRTPECGHAATQWVCKATSEVEEAERSALARVLLEGDRGGGRRG